MSIRVLGLAYLPRRNATARHRLYHWVELLAPHGIALDIHAPCSDGLFAWAQLGRWRKAIMYIVMFWSRLVNLMEVRRYDVVIIQRELFPYGPPFFEWAVCRLARRVFYDLDDAIYETPPHAAKAWLGLRKLIIDSDKARKIAGWVDAAIVGNHNLALYLKPVARRLFVIPTFVHKAHDRALLTQESAATRPVVVGWIGSPGNLRYLLDLASALREAQCRVPFVFRVVCSHDIDIPGVDMEFHVWTEAGELDELYSFDIGIMPLPDNQYTRGKCAFKLLQYMRVGIPVVCTPVGMNADVVQHGSTGFVANSHEDWVNALTALTANSGLRHQLGQAGRALVESQYVYDRWIATMTSILTGEEVGEHG